LSGSCDGEKKIPTYPVGTKVVINENGLSALLMLLIDLGYDPIAPKEKDGAIIYDKISSIQELPIGLSDHQSAGKYRLIEGTKGAFFEYVVGPTSWKKYLFPPKHKMWEADKKGKSFKIKSDKTETPKYAFIGVRSCELSAMNIQDKVYGFDRDDDCEAGIFSDPNYVNRRSHALIIAVNCSRAGENCFCTSMGGDPHNNSSDGFDLSLTELSFDGEHEFVMEVGSERGALLLEMLPFQKATQSHLNAEKEQAKKVRSQITKTMPKDVKSILSRNLESSHWDDIADRCLSCANCTMVCPTCFCSTVEDTTDLSGDHTERWRTWDSCFSIDFSYIHGGAIRTETKSRYRQWMTHKLSNWIDQFGTSGCVGCGRCITWCPVGIDITEEAKAIKESEG